MNHKEVIDLATRKGYPRAYPAVPKDKEVHLIRVWLKERHSISVVVSEVDAEYSWMHRETFGETLAPAKEGYKTYEDALLEGTYAALTQLTYGKHI